MFVAKAIVGASFTAVTVIRKLLVVVSTPPSATPPLSWKLNVTREVPFALTAGVNRSTPLVSNVGCALNSVPFVTLRIVTFVTLCPASSAGPTVKAAKVRFV